MTQHSPTRRWHPRRDDRLSGACLFLPALALVAFIRYVPALADAMSDHPSQKGDLAGPSFFWAIALLDLGVFLPATVATCSGLVAGKPWARKARDLVAGWSGLVGPAVAGMAIAMQANDHPTASLGSTIFMTALGGAFLLLVLWIYRPLLRSAHGPRSSTKGGVK